MTSSRSRSRSRSHSLGSICLDDTFLRNQVLRSLTRKHLSAVSAACQRYVPQHCLGCRLRSLRLMETPVCGACGMSTVHAQHCLGCRLRRLRLMETPVCGACGMSTVHAQHCLRCCLRRLRLMETPVCGACGMSTVRAPVLSGMPLTALTVNGNTSLRCLRHVNLMCPSTVWDAACGAYG